MARPALRAVTAAILIVAAGMVTPPAGLAAPAGEPPAWSIVDSPNAPDSQTSPMLAVTCVSATDCWAVGSHLKDNTYQALVRHWDGTSWEIAPTPNAGGTAPSFLRGVACTSTSDCWAVGYRSNFGIPQTLVEHWDGTSWAIVESPNVISAAPNYLNAVTCLSKTDCWAVGYYHQYLAGQLVTGVSIIERWNGTSWTIVESPGTTPAQRNVLTGVTCVSSVDCWAVGHQYVGGNAYAGEGSVVGDTVSRTLIEHWNGTSWAVVDSPNSAAQRSFLTGVTCSSATECWAVGYDSNGVRDAGYAQARDITEDVAATNQTLIERWDGTAWRVVASPNTDPAQRNYLGGVTCAAPTACWAVGHYDSGSEDQTLVVRWDGATWTIVSSPNAGSVRNNRLDAVTCVERSSCWSVGLSHEGSLFERWDGTQWAVVPSAHLDPPPRMVNDLRGVTCVSKSDCWAVGTHDTAGNTDGQTLIQRWNGAAWEIVPSPGTPDQDQLYGVTCVSATDCWAVGSAYSRTLPTSRTLALHWNGSSWSIVESPDLAAGQRNVFNGVSCVSATNCWAAGFSITGENVVRTLIERWDGTSWSIVDSPNVTSAQRNFLNGVTCTSGTECWAVGYSSNGGNNQVPGVQTLVQRWNGTSWTIVPSPNTSPTQYNALASVACASASDCWAVGYHNNGSAYQTLVERWNGSSWTIVSSPNTTTTQNNNLYSVTCASASECWAVGQESTTISANKTLIERWDGTSWSVVPSPNPSGGQVNFLLGATCAAASECWAVGYYYVNGGTFHTLTERYSICAATECTLS